MCVYVYDTRRLFVETRTAIAAKPEQDKKIPRQKFDKHASENSLVMVSVIVHD